MAHSACSGRVLCSFRFLLKTTACFTAIDKTGCLLFNPIQGIYLIEQTKTFKSFIDVYCGLNAVLDLLQRIIR